LKTELTGLEPDNFPWREATDNPKITLSPRMQAFADPVNSVIAAGIYVLFEVRKGEAVLERRRLDKSDRFLSAEPSQGLRGDGKVVRGFLRR
jgi:hypothetical protein